MITRGTQRKEEVGGETAVVPEIPLCLSLFRSTEVGSCGWWLRSNAIEHLCSRS